MCAGDVTISGTTTFSKGVLASGATTAIDFSGASGAFKTTAGAHDPSKTDKTHDVVPYERLDTAIDP